MIRGLGSGESWEDFSATIPNLYFLTLLLVWEITAFKGEEKGSLVGRKGFD